MRGSLIYYRITRVTKFAKNTDNCHTSPWVTLLCAYCVARWKLAYLYAKLPIVSYIRNENGKRY